jgi:hypothetical protein
MNKKTKVAKKKHHQKVKKLKAKTRARREAATKAKATQA